MSVMLLDVNVLVALFVARHVHHEVAHDWFEDQRALGWATCPVTENGFVRLMSQPVGTSVVYRPVEAVEMLRVFCKSGHHHFWPDSVSLADARVFDPALIRGHKQITDVYLLGLAKSAGGALATFDRTISLGAVKGATKVNLQVISAAPAESRSGDT
jgi:hypothetical protein